MPVQKQEQRTAILRQDTNGTYRDDFFTPQYILIFEQITVAQTYLHVYNTYMIEKYFGERDVNP